MIKHGQLKIVSITTFWLMWRILRTTLLFLATNLWQSIILPNLPKLPIKGVIYHHNFLLWLILCSTCLLTFIHNRNLLLVLRWIFAFHNRLYNLGAIFLGTWFEVSQLIQTLHYILSIPLFEGTLKGIPTTTTNLSS